MTRRIAAVACILGLAVLPILLTGTARAEAEEEITLSFEGPIPLERFLSQMTEELDIALVWDPMSRALQNKQIVGKLQFQGTKGAILESVRGLLTFYELVLIPIGQHPNEKLLLMDARATSAMVKLKPKFVELTPENVDFYSTQDGLFLSTTIKVDHMENLRDARNALNRIVTGQNIGSVTEVPAARAFVVTDFAPNIVAIWRLLREMDVPFAGPATEDPGREVIFRAFGLKHAQAAAAASTLEQHFGANAAQRQRPGPRSPQGQDTQVPPTPLLRIHADARLNQLLVTGMRKDVDRVAEVILAMDAAATRPDVHLQFLRLAHVDAIGSAAALGALIRRHPEVWGNGPSGAMPVIEAHPETNALLIQADEAALGVLRRLIAEMDQPPQAQEPEAGPKDE